jgi:hypothetical protein
METTQLRFASPEDTSSLTVFSPPGIFTESSRYPIMWAGVLGTVQPSEWLSIFDHPEAWRGLDRKAILRMRQQLYRFVLPVDAKEMTPHSVVDSLQTVALSVSPIAIEVDSPHLPRSELKGIGGQSPMGQLIKCKSLEIVSNPEISRVAKRICDKDVPSAESVWQLLDYDYTLDQVARMMSVGLLGHKKRRRLVPLRSAYKAVIDSYLTNAVMNLVESPLSSSIRLHASTLHGDSFTVLLRPGEPRVDYLRLESFNGLNTLRTSFEGLETQATDPKTSVYADHARFSAYRNMIGNTESSHIVIFHQCRDPHNLILGPWVARAGVRYALDGDGVELDNMENAVTVMNSLLKPKLEYWGLDNPLLSRIHEEIKIRIQH